MQKSFKAEQHGQCHSLFFLLFWSLSDIRVPRPKASQPTTAPQISSHFAGVIAEHAGLSRSMGLTNDYWHLTEPGLATTTKISFLSV